MKVGYQPVEMSVPRRQAAGRADKDRLKAQACLYVLFVKEVVLQQLGKALL